MSPICCSTIWCAARGAIRRAINFPTTAEFDPVATVPILIEGSRLHLGALIALVAVVVAWIAARPHHQGLRDPRGRRGAAGGALRRLQLRPAGDLSRSLMSGALAGLAGIIEVAGPVGHLQPDISPGYGFTAIIVAFLGRLNPIGILIAGLFLALTFIGGEQAQISMKLPLDLTEVFQGILLFYVLACDSLILYRIRLVARQPRRRSAHERTMLAAEAIILSVHRGLDAAAARGGRRTRGRALRRAQSRRRGHDDHGRGLRLRAARIFTGSTLVGALLRHRGRRGAGGGVRRADARACGQPGRDRTRADDPRRRPFRPDRRGLRRRADRARARSSISRV